MHKTLFRQHIQSSLLYPVPLQPRLWDTTTITENSLSWFLAAKGLELPEEVTLTTRADIPECYFVSYCCCSILHV